MIGKFFKKKKAEVKVLKNTDLAEAVVSICIAVAYADGDCSDDELATTTAIMEASPALAGLSSVIATTTARTLKAYEAGPRMGKMFVMRELRDCKHDESEKEEVMVAGITIAESDGEIDTKELVILKECATALGLNLSSFGL